MTGECSGSPVYPNVGVPVLYAAASATIFWIVSAGVPGHAPVPMQRATAPVVAGAAMLVPDSTW